MARFVSEEKATGTQLLHPFITQAVTAGFQPAVLDTARSSVRFERREAHKEF